MPAVTLAPVTPELRDAVARLAPHPEQERYSGRAAEALRPAARDAARTPVAILAGDTPVGFFVLQDQGETVLLRAFFVDRAHQGRGYAGAALRRLPAFVRDRFPHATSIALTVNVENPVAVRTYLRGGFVDTGRLDHSGAHGPQHVLVLGVT